MVDAPLGNDLLIDLSPSALKRQSLWTRTRIGAVAVGILLGLFGIYEVLSARIYVLGGGFIAIAVSLIYSYSRKPPMIVASIRVSGTSVAFVPLVGAPIAVEWSDPNFEVELRDLSQCPAMHSQSQRAALFVTVQSRKNVECRMDQPHAGVLIQAARDVGMTVTKREDRYRTRASHVDLVTTILRTPSTIRFSGTPLVS
jgi:hypothetical protein